MNAPPVRHRSDLRTAALYVAVMLREFRWTIFTLLVALAVGTAAFATASAEALGLDPGSARPDPGAAAYGAWMALFAQPVWALPRAWSLQLLCALYPLVGFGVIGEGIVRLGILLNAKRNNEREWMKVSASTYRDHVILCGLGSLGYRILEQLREQGLAVVAIEKSGDARFVAAAKSTGTPVLVRDAKEDQALVDAGISHARVIIIATNDDLANIEVALDARRLNPRVRVVMRQYEQAIAAKIKEAGVVDVAFSSTALAAPLVAGLAIERQG